MKKPITSWNDIVAHYTLFKRNNFNIQTERARYLQWLQRDTPWKERNRYASEAVYLDHKDLSWRDVVVEQLNENFTEVQNTIKLLVEYKEAKMRTYGRDALLKIYNRTRSADKDTVNSIFNNMNNVLLDTGAAPSPHATEHVLDMHVPRLHSNPTLSMVEGLKKKALEYKIKYNKERAIVTKLLDIIVNCPKCTVKLNKLNIDLS